jgi:DNA-binding response OmpR family regulator
MHQESMTDGDSREPVKVLISRLRVKLEEAKLTSPSIRTVRGFGYVLDRRARTR